MDIILIKIYRRIFSIIKIIFYKIIFWKRLEIKNILKSYCLCGTKIDINKGKCIFEGSPCLRENIKLNISSGTLRIGENTFINTNTTINCRNEITIGKNCLFGEGVRIYDHDHMFYLSEKLIERNEFKTKPVLIGNNCWIGANVVILKGVKIGDNSVIGAGTIVTKDVPKNTVFYSKQNSVLKSKK